MKSQAKPTKSQTMNQPMPKKMMMSKSEMMMKNKQMMKMAQKDMCK